MSVLELLALVALSLPTAVGVAWLVLELDWRRASRSARRRERGRVGEIDLTGAKPW